MKPITDEMFYQLVDMRMSEPVPLKDADLNEPFIYDRDFGVFYVDSGYHMLGMAMLFAWKHNFTTVFELKRGNEKIAADIKANSFGSSIDKYQYLADRFLLDFKGTAMSSSVSNHLLAGSEKNLNEQEKIILGRYDIQFLE